MKSPSEPEFDNTLTSRYECKYLIQSRTADALRRFLRLHTELDPHSAAHADRRYRVYSLYLDSPGLQLYRDTCRGVRNRYKLRLRYYSETGPGPIFLEVKKRSDIIVRKNRERVSRQEAEEFLRSGTLLDGSDHGPDLGEFLRRCQECDAQPALRLRYRREAWESRGVDPVRITFDSELEHSPLSGRGLVESRPRWQATPLRTSVILEVKFTDLRPLWLDQLLRVFQLDKVSVAKYAESVDRMMNTGQEQALRARMGQIDSARRPSPLAHPWRLQA